MLSRQLHMRHTACRPTMSPPPDVLATGCRSPLSASRKAHLEVISHFRGECSLVLNTESPLRWLFLVEIVFKLHLP
jgi:hypothetical protein